MYKQFPYEFGGPRGSLCIIAFSHIILYYLYWCLGVEEWIPTTFTMTTYAAFLVIQALFAVVMPGVWTRGLPLKDNPGRGMYSLDYLCNGLCSWYVTLLMLFGMHYLGYFKIFWITDNIGRYMTTAVIHADLSSVIIYIWGVLTDTSRKDVKRFTHELTNIRDEFVDFDQRAKLAGVKTEYPGELLERHDDAYEKWNKASSNYDMSGNHIYDFFMGSILNPRIDILDLKMFAEIRVSWMLLFLITTANALKQLEEYGEISNSMIVIWIAQTLYTNACMKGEECIPTTWDIFHEKFGWMLIFWNMAGVPFLYAINSYYIYRNNISAPNYIFLPLLFGLLIAYGIWDTANSQKNRFRMQQRGTYIKRKWAFPQFEWGTLENPKYIITKTGSKLLVSGWWGVARKIHYTADLIMALIWGLCCGFESFIPYFYFFFFLVHLLHRSKRDNKRCSKKYGRDWKTYCEMVPYTFIPYIY